MRTLSHPCGLFVRQRSVSIRWSYSEEEGLPVEQVGGQHPQGRSPHALEQEFPVAVLETHIPAEREVEAQQGVSDVHQDGVHP